MYILANMWFTKLMKQFFFWLDKVVFNFISEIYDLLITIARTSILSQADIIEMADRIYKLLAVFMIFKVTLSLITYVVNPDEFSDKSKGVAKLGTNIIISLSLLILTPYIFNYAYQFQTIILEDNSLATLVFGESSEEENSFFNTAGDDMAFITMSAFLSPNLSLGNLHECSVLLDPSTNAFNSSCKKELEAMTDDETFPTQTLTNYIAGVENKSLGLLFRQDLVLATNSENEDFIMDYKFVFSTAVGVVIILLLITFCMDVALRSIKLAFLQLVAPIPILSYVDPKSGKDGLFKKWYEMCFKTFLSLFIRLLALYFAVYIISRVADMKLVDVIDGSYRGGFLLSVFVIIGALMFAKQLPKMLEGLGIKLDGGGKFTLNPFKKFEEETIGGKRFTGAVGGAAAGLIGGKGLGAFTGAVRGFAQGKGYAGGLAAQADVNRKVREARIKGAGRIGAGFAALSNRYGLDDADLEGRAVRLRKDKRAVELKRREVDSQVKDREVQKKSLENSIAPQQAVIAKQNAVKSGVDEMEKFSVSLIEGGKAGKYSKRFKEIRASHETLANNVGKIADIDHFDSSGNIVVRRGETISSSHVQQMEGEDEKYLRKIAKKQLMDDMLVGNASEVSTDDQQKFSALKRSYNTEVEELNKLVNTTPGTTASTATEYNTYDDLHSQAGLMERTVIDEESAIKGTKGQIESLDREIKHIQTTNTVKISGSDQEVTLEEAERLLKDRETELKDEQEQRSLNRGLARDQRIGGGSGK